jgi:tRNA (guanine-N7-)-methyltransferase
MKHHPYAADAPRLPEGEALDPRTLFATSAGPLELEIGPGRGGFIFERLSERPDVRVLGLEIRLKWATIVDRRLHEQGLAERGRVFAEDARHAVSRFPDACLDAVFVHFPDPWWKKRHQKRLVMGDRMLDQLSRALRPGGQLFLQTDVPERADGYEALFAEHSAFAPFGGVARVEASPVEAQSPRERRAKADGLPIYRLHFRRL